MPLSGFGLTKKALNVDNAYFIQRQKKNQICIHDYILE